MWWSDSTYFSVTYQLCCHTRQCPQAVRFSALTTTFAKHTFWHPSVPVQFFKKVVIPSSTLLVTEHTILSQNISSVLFPVCQNKHVLARCQNMLKKRVFCHAKTKYSLPVHTVKKLQKISTFAFLINLSTCFLVHYMSYQSVL